MKVADYKGQEISVSESTGKFFIEGGSKEFASLGRAKKFIDAQYPEKPFIPFEIFSIDGWEAGWRGAPTKMKVYPYTVVGAEYTKSRRRWSDDYVSFVLRQPDGHTSHQRDDYGTFYDKKNLDIVKAKQEEIDELSRKINALNKEKDEKEKEMKEKYEISLKGMSELMGNKTPTQEL